MPVGGNQRKGDHGAGLCVILMRVKSVSHLRSVPRGTADAPSVGAVGTEARPAAVERVSGSPESALLAVELSLARIQGDRNLYHQLLVIFAQTYADAADKLRAALPTRRAEAYRIVHSLKGAAATVGADQVVTAAAQLETALRAGEPPLSALVRELERSLHAALRAAEQLIASSPRG